MLNTESQRKTQSVTSGVRMGDLKQDGSKWRKEGAQKSAERSSGFFFPKRTHLSSSGKRSGETNDEKPFDEVTDFGKKGVCNFPNTESEPGFGNFK